MGMHLCLRVRARASVHLSVRVSCIGERACIVVSLCVQVSGKCKAAACQWLNVFVRAYEIKCVCRR
jgi:hypothetical protein